MKYYLLFILSVVLGYNTRSKKTTKLSTLKRNKLNYHLIMLMKVSGQSCR